MTAQKLKALIQRLYKVDSEIKLSYVSKKVRKKNLYLYAAKEKL
jgi:hypothetical protein